MSTPGIAADATAGRAPSPPVGTGCGVRRVERDLDLLPGVGGMPKAKGVAERLNAWLKTHADMPGAPLLQRMVPFAVTKFGFDPDKFVHELVDSILGDHYPVPDRMLVHNEQIVHEYLEWAMCGEPHPKVGR